MEASAVELLLHLRQVLDRRQECLCIDHFKRRKNSIGQHVGLLLNQDDTHILVFASSLFASPPVVSIFCNYGIRILTTAKSSQCTLYPFFPPPTHAQSKAAIDLKNNASQDGDTAYRVEAHPFAPQPRGNEHVWLHLFVSRGIRRLFDVTCQTLPKQYLNLRVISLGIVVFYAY